MTANGRVALVSGANRGIGREVARQLAERGLTVMIGARDRSKAEEAAAAIGEAGGRAHAVQLDVADDASVERAAGEVRDRAGRLDVLVNNAGVTGDTSRRGADPDLDEFRQVLETNLFGAWRLSRALLPLMREGGYGRIVNISSGMGQLSDMGGGAPSYRLSKAGLNVMTRILASELGGSGILVNSVCPGWVRTDMGGGNARLSVAEGASDVVWLAVEAPHELTGRFVKERKVIPW